MANIPVYEISGILHEVDETTPLFTMDSGLRTMPQKGDIIQHNGRDYQVIHRVFNPVGLISITVYMTLKNIQ